MRQAAQPTLAHRLASARVFLGRAAELARFDRMLQAPLPPVPLLWWHGPGGIGKTSLLQQLRQRAADSGRRVVAVDARLLEPQPAAFLAALALDDPRGAAEPGVLFIDTCERLAPLEPWLRECFLPALPAHWLVVCAGRSAPGADWRLDAQWSACMEAHELQPLDPTTASALLAARGVPAARQQDALRFARGHPLALCLLAEVLVQDEGAALPAAPQAAVMQDLVERFTREVQQPAQRDALRLAAFARHTTEALLAAVLGRAAAPALFDWLRGLAFMQATPEGLLPHELVREVLASDALWRDAGGSDALRRAVARHCYECIAASTGRARVHYQAEVLYVQRHSLHKQKFFDWDELDAHRVEPARAEDDALVETMVLRHAGAAALPWLRHWWRRQRAGFQLFWNAEGGCDGFLLMLRLPAQTPAGDLADPAVAAAWSFVAAQRPLAAGEELVLLRHWMHTHKHQAVTAAINLTAMHVVTHILTTPEVAWSAVYMADPQFWQPHFDGVHFTRCAAADFEEGGRRYGAFVHDWRREPPAAWVAGDYRPMPFEADAAATGETLDEAAFLAAVHQALRDFTDDRALRQGALARALALPVDALRERMRQAVRQLGAHPRDHKFEQALWHTYIEPRHKQEQVAADLGVPLPTYRYRLQQGMVRLAALLRG